jgi:hypothetical protein
MFDVADVQTSAVRAEWGAFLHRHHRCSSVRRGVEWSRPCTTELTDASRQVSATAQQIAAAAGTLADLAGNLEATAATTRERN